MGERIDKVSIQNFKSIRGLEFEARRVNLFIGEPNAGKSNILEALAFFSEGTYPALKQVIRFKTPADLFFDQRVTDRLQINAGRNHLSLKFAGENYQGHLFGTPFRLSTNGAVESGSLQKPFVRNYVFRQQDVFPDRTPGVLRSPFGDNLVAVLFSNEELRKRIGALVRQKGFRLQLKPTENEVLITKDVGDELYSYPWSSVSETLRRMVFLMAALETNRDATLLLDEPEANTFPFYTKYLAERIALDESNQFFITTHNPYLLSSVVEKTPVNDLAVFVTRMENFETKVTKIPDHKLPELLELDSAAFFNLDRLTEA